MSATIRQFIAEEVSAGSDDLQIRDQLVTNYGTEVLLNPPADGFAALIWILPVIVLVFSSMAAGIAFTRAGPRADRQATDEDRDLVDEARRHLATSDGRPDSGG